MVNSLKTDGVGKRNANEVRAARPDSTRSERSRPDPTRLDPDPARRAARRNSARHAFHLWSIYVRDDWSTAMRVNAGGYAFTLRRVPESFPGT